MMLAGLKELMKPAEEGVAKIERQMRTQKDVMDKFVREDKKGKGSQNFRKADKLAAKINKTLD